MQALAQPPGAPIPRRHAILTGLLLGCCNQPPPQPGPGIHETMERYQRALDTPEGDSQARLTACLALADPDLAGDCALAVARAEAPRGDAGVEALCERIPPGLWQAECYFELAEQLRSRDKARAVALCDRSEPFRDDCRQHLWQGELKQLVDRAGPEGFAAQLAQAEAMHDAWATLLGVDAQHSHRFWQHYYQAGLGGMIPLDLGVCEPLPALHRERCLEAGVASFEDNLEQAMRDLSNQDVICSPRRPDLLLEQIAEIGHLGRVIPHPRLEEAVELFQQSSCMRLGPEAWH
jgi:hypothetical protein